ncbi:MAG: DUF4062 domain-containing protein [Allosphingosinicella sp.]
MAHRPTFFLSSTIYDFRDLRSAIKFTLEARGCRVLASEFNDFGGRLDQHSYEACLSNIEQADFFVLLIGGRVGGWYDKPGRISITQQEYRTAYNLHEAGKLRLVTFAREEVWQLREDRKELTRFLAEMKLSENERATIAAAPSKFAGDAEFVSEFITEVGRNHETTRAVMSGGEKPSGNWIYRFSTFREIHDVLQPLAFTGLTSEEAAYRKALQNELLIVMSRLLAKFEGSVIDLRPSLRKFLQANPITVEERDRGWLAVDLTEWNAFATIFYQILGCRFEPVVIKDALTSTIFLDYDAGKGAYIQNAAYDALSQLWDEIRLFNDLSVADNLSIIHETSPRALGRNSGSARLEAHKAALLYSIAHRWINIIGLAEALILHLEGRPSEPPALMPFSPILGFEENVRSERVSVAELRAVFGI